MGRYSLLISLTILLGEQRPRLRCVLELAAGTGIVTRRLRDLLPREARLVATDLKPPMLEVARGKFRPDETVEFQPADATALPFPNASFDSVVCQFGVMFFPDTSVAISAANIRYTEARPIRNWRAIDWQLSDDGGQGPSGGGRRTRCQYYSTRTVNPCLSKIGLAAADVKNSNKRCAAGS